MDFDGFISNVRNLSAEDVILEAAGKNTNELADLNVQQLEKGLLSTGEKVKPEYASDEYAKFKKSIGSKSSPTPDLKVTGAFHEGFFTKIESGKIKFGSTNEKSDRLQYDYSDEIFGVTTENLIDQIDPDCLDIIDKMLMK